MKIQLSFSKPNQPDQKGRIADLKQVVSDLNDHVDKAELEAFSLSLSNKEKATIKYGDLNIHATPITSEV